MLNARLENLDPLQQATYNTEPVRKWRITWPDGKQETISGHGVMVTDGIMSFYFLYMGGHRYINLQHVRDVEELPTTDE